jgi:hypothetical protein
MSVTENRDYHALDRLYAIQGEERQERRGLETRAIASIVAALTAVAFSTNAISDRLTAAEPLPIVLLAVGASVIFAGVFLCTFTLLGGSSATIGVARAVGAALAKVNLVTLPALGLSVSLDRDLERARLDVLDAARIVRIRVTAEGGKTTADAGNAASALAKASKLLQKLAAGSSPVGGYTFVAAPPTVAGKLTELPATQTDGADETLREPEDLQEAMRLADLQARRLRDENGAAVLVLKVSTLLISLGVLILVSGVVLLLAQKLAALPVQPPVSR